MHVLADTSGILKKALFAGKDSEFGYVEEVTNENGEVKSQWINTSQYGFDIAVQVLKTFCNQLNLNPKDIIWVKEGINGSQFRKSIYPEYKQGRTKSQAIFNEYNKLEEMWTEAMLNLGSQVVSHPGVEADDLIAWLAQTITSQFPRGESVLVWSVDGDLAILSNYPKISTRINGSFDKNPFGDFPTQFIDVYKATVGDTSDNIKGAPGFGKKAFEAVYAKFGDNGLAVLRNLIETKSLVKMQEDVEQCPQLQKLIDHAQSVELSLKCAKLHTEMIQPSLLEWQHGINRAGVIHHPYLAQYAQRVIGVTQSNFNEVFSQIKRIASENQYVSLDIETSTPEESDDWLAAINATKKGHGQKLDVFGSELVSVQLTLGGNFQYTFDFSINHADTDNLSPEMVEQVLLFLNPTHRFVIQNVNFELPVLKNTYGWFLRDIDDTKLMASYVDENSPLGLKENSKRWLNYEQATFAETVTDSDGHIRKMDELTLTEALSYAADDTICTAALFQWYRLFMHIEGSWEIYRKVEIDAAFWTAQAFLDGLNINLATLAALDKRDKAELEKHQNEIYQYLIKRQWEGSVFKPLTEENYKTPEGIKYAYQLLKGQPFKTRKRKFEALLEELSLAGADDLRSWLEDGDLEYLNKALKAVFSGQPNFNFNSPDQLAKLMYKTLQLPVHIRNKQTKLQYNKGKDGSPKTDADAIELAICYDTAEGTEEREVLENLLVIKTLQTRFNLFYKTYRMLPHWKDRKIHASLNQCSTNTRRFSSSNPNLQQFPKGAGDFRTVIEPHHNQAMIVSLDFSAQELRIIADLSQDENMLSCYVGENLRDMHSITGAKISGMDYEAFKAIQVNEDDPRHKEISNWRKLAKTVNFGTQYGVEAQKLSITLRCSEYDASEYIKAKVDAFPGVEQWKTRVVKQAKALGYSLTMLGARRHLENINSSNIYEASKDERRAVNFMVQGSGAEMTKLAMGRIYKAGIRDKYDIRFLAPIHDELVFSIAIKDMPEVIPQIYKAMTAPYANMEVPIQSSVSIGRTFGDQHELGDDVVPTAENITALINKVSERDLQAA